MLDLVAGRGDGLALRSMSAARTERPLILPLRFNPSDRASSGSTKALPPVYWGAFCRLEPLPAHTVSPSQPAPTHLGLPSVEPRSPSLDV